jgi:Family of unknown function (DUF6494)
LDGDPSLAASLELRAPKNKPARRVVRVATLIWLRNFGLLNSYLQACLHPTKNRPAAVHPCRPVVFPQANHGAAELAILPDLLVGPARSHAVGVLVWSWVVLPLCCGNTPAGAESCSGIVRLPRRESGKRRQSLFQRSVSRKEAAMNEDVFNTSIRKFLKTLGVTGQREMEKAVRQALADGKLKGNEKLSAQGVITIGTLQFRHEVSETIELT